MPGAWGCKDENSVFMYGNAEYGRIIGVKHHEDVIGRTDFEMPCATTNCAHLFRAQDKKVIQTLEKMRILDIHPFAGGQWKAYIFTKTPMLDEEQNVIGTIYHGADITNTTSIEIGSLLARVSVEGVKNELLGQNSYMLSHKFCDIKLTCKQSEVLFYLLRGKTVKKIALILGLSPRTIEEHIESLKNKFLAFNKSELIDKAICKGFLNTIPERLLRSQLSLELKDW
jgi:DNA-binding CsgD family transcriptional regulator